MTESAPQTTAAASPPTSLRARCGRLLRRLRRVPAPLAAVLLVAFAVEVTWALVQPPWQAPDEQVHFAYAQSLAADLKLPGDPDRPPFSTQQGLALQRTDLNGIAFHAMVPAVWDPLLVASWRAEQARLPANANRDGGGPNPAEPNPPLYYTLLAPAYGAASVAGGTVIDHMYAMRIWSGLLLLVTVTATWLLAGELFGRRRLLQTAAAGIVALQPEIGFISAMTNPDALLTALWATAAWLGVRTLRRGLDVGSALGLGAIAAGAVLTKATGYALLLGILALLAFAAWRTRRRGSGRWKRGLLIGAAVALVPVVLWVGAARVMDRQVVNGSTTVGAAVSPLSMSYLDFARYLRRFYVPEASLSGVANGNLGHLWVNGAWGRFGFVDVNLPEQTQRMLQLLSLLALVGMVVAVVRRLRRGEDPAVPLYLLLLALLLLGALHYADFQQITSAAAAGQPPPAFMQGRYILPMVPLLACAAVAALTLVPRRARGPAIGVVLGGMWCLQLLSLGLVLERYFA